MRGNSRHCGYSSVLIMILLVVGFTLCVWLFTSLGNATAMTRNELDQARAMAAAESGLDAMLYELRNVTAKTGFRRTRTMSDTERVDAGLLAQLCIGMKNHYALGTMAGPFTVDASPAEWFTVGPVALADDCNYSATVTPMKRAAVYGHGYTIEVKGASGHASSTICLDVTPQMIFGSSSMDFPIATRGSLNITGAAEIYRYDPEAGKAVLTDAGKVLNLTEDGPGLLYFGPEPDHETTPIFPDKYMSDQAYSALGAMAGKQLATVTATSLTSPLRNIHLPPAAGKNAPPIVFPDNCTIEGIVYVGWPNTISFGSNVTLNGVIIYQKPPEPITGESIILLNRANTVSGSRDSAEDAITALLGTAQYTGDEQILLAAELSEWLIHAPDTDFDLQNGNTTSTSRTFDGNFHIRSLGKSTGGGNADANNLIIRGQILCEGDVDLGGNRVFCIEPPDEDDNKEAVRRLKLDVSQGGYWEPVP